MVTIKCDYSQVTQNITKNDCRVITRPVSLLTNRFLERPATFVACDGTALSVVCFCTRTTKISRSDPSSTDIVGISCIE